MLFSLTTALAEETEQVVEEVKEPFISLVQQPFEKLGKAGWSQLAVLVALIALGLFMLHISRKNVKWSAKMISHAAMSLALSFVLSYIKLFSMSAGGSVTPGSMLPIMLFSASYGTAPGLLVGFAYALLQLVQKNSAVGFYGYLLDYFLAFSALGLAGLAKLLPKQWGLYVAMLIAMVVRFLSHSLSSIVVYNTTIAGSLAYNIPYMLPEIIFTMILGVLVGPRIVKMMQSDR